MLETSQAGRQLRRSENGGRPLSDPRPRKGRELRVDGWGITSGFKDVSGHWRPTTSSTRDSLRRAMGDPPPESTGVADEPVIVLREGQPGRVLEESADLWLEDGTRVGVGRMLPPDLPAGYHELRFRRSGRNARLIVTPGHCYLPPDLNAWGWAIQAYALRSQGSWGMGDLSDLREWVRWSRKELGTGFTLVNPLGAPLPLPDQDPSPYAPSSRLYRNPLYLRVEEIPGARQMGLRLHRLAAAGRALNTDPRIDRAAVFRLKMPALEILFTLFKGADSFDRYCAREGKSLETFATFCALAEAHRSGWTSWPARFRHPKSPAVREFAAEHPQRIRFHQWLQWQLDEQLARAAQDSSLMLDLPIGVRPDGADAWAWQDLMARDVTVGAPPDDYNAAGQNWGLPPFVPHKLREAGYEPLRQTFRAAMKCAKGLRVDHVMGLFRLFWIPPGTPPSEGGYVRYRADEILAVLSIESQRARAVVVGEDLGTVEAGVRRTLRRHGLLSCRLFWFESRPPERYPRQSLAAITTHDLPTIAGAWSGADLEIQQACGLTPDPSTAERLRRKLRAASKTRGSTASRKVIAAVHRRLAQAPSMLISATLEDALAVERRPNLPGTMDASNWQQALPMPLEKIRRDSRVRELSRALGQRGRRAGELK